MVNAKTAMEVKPMKRRRRERFAWGGEGWIEAEGLGAAIIGLVLLLGKGLGCLYLTGRVGSGIGSPRSSGERVADKES